jgi:hypothetical protein
MNCESLRVSPKIVRSPGKTWVRTAGFPSQLIASQLRDVEIHVVHRWHPIYRVVEDILVGWASQDWNPSIELLGHRQLYRREDLKPRPRHPVVAGEIVWSHSRHMCWVAILLSLSGLL